MIYLTVGTQLAFDRMAGVVNNWVVGTDVEVVAQIGPSDTVFSNIQSESFFSPSQSYDYFSKAEVIVSHAGMGSILTACELGKVIIIFPRCFDLGEHRNDHQLATAKKFEGFSNIHVAYNEETLIELLNSRESLSGGGSNMSKYAPADFISVIDSYLVD